MSALRPHCRRDRRRSSKGASADVGLSQATTICRLESVERIEGVEEALLYGLLPAQELDVVHQKDVHRPVLLPKRAGALHLNGRDELVGELLGAHVQVAEAVAGRRMTYAV